jgi:hypothetical protein
VASKAEELMINNANQEECNCIVSREERDVNINGNLIKAIVCPKCGYMIYSGEQLQIYFEKLRSSRDKKKEVEI